MALEAHRERQSYCVYDIIVNIFNCCDVFFKSRTVSGRDADPLVTLSASTLSCFRGDLERAPFEGERCISRIMRQTHLGVRFANYASPIISAT